MECDCQGGHYTSRQAARPRSPPCRASTAPSYHMLPLRGVRHCLVDPGARARRAVVLLTSTPRAIASRLQSTRFEPGAVLVHLASSTGIENFTNDCRLMQRPPQLAHAPLPAAAGMDLQRSTVARRHDDACGHVTIVCGLTPPPGRLPVPPAPLFNTWQQARAQESPLCQLALGLLLA